MLKHFLITEFCNRMSYAQNTADNFTMAIERGLHSEDKLEKMLKKRNKAIDEVKDLQEEIDALRKADDKTVQKLWELALE